MKALYTLKCLKYRLKDTLEAIIYVLKDNYPTEINSNDVKFYRCHSPEIKVFHAKVLA